MVSLRYKNEIETQPVMSSGFNTLKQINADTNIDAIVEAEMANFDSDWEKYSQEWSKELSLVTV